MKDLEAVLREGFFFLETYPGIQWQSCVALETTKLFSKVTAGTYVPVGWDNHRIRSRSDGLDL